MDEGTRWLTHRRYLYLLAKVAFFAALLYAGVQLFGNLAHVLVPLGLSFLIAYLLDPVVDWFEERGVHRTLAIFIILIGFLAGVGIFVVVIAPTLVEQVGDLATDKIPHFIRGLRGRYMDYNALVEKKTGYVMPQTVAETFEAYGQKLQDLVSEMVNRITSMTGDVLRGTVGVMTYLANVFLVPLFIFHYLRHFNRIKAFALDLVPLPHRDRVLAKATRIDQVVGRWFRGQLTVAVTLGALYALGLFIVDVKMGIAIGILAGLLAIVPYLGFMIGLTIALLMSGLDPAAGWGQIFAVLAVFTLVQTLDAYFITPKIVGDKTGLSPVMVIVSLLIGASLFGFVGVLLAVPTTAVIRVLLLDAIADYKRSPRYLGDDNYLTLLSHGAAAVNDQVKRALKQAAEADLDMDLPAPLSHEELGNLSVAIMKARRSASDTFTRPQRFTKDGLHQAIKEDSSDEDTDGE